jgi:hypothetical protein
LFYTFWLETVYSVFRIIRDIPISNHIFVYYYVYPLLSAQHSSVRTNQTIFFFLYLICWSFMTINKYKHKLRLCCTRTNQRILFDLFKESWSMKRQIFTRNIVLKIKTNISWIIFRNGRNINFELSWDYLYFNRWIK